MIRSLLVANRGEIARRIIRTCHALGIRTVAVHSEADADQPFVDEADVAVCIGALGAASSYLNIANILDVMMWSTTLSSKRYLHQLVASGRGDLYLAPPVQNFELLGFDALEQLYQVGYEYACQKLDEWDGLQEIAPETQHLSNYIESSPYWGFRDVKKP